MTKVFYYENFQLLPELNWYCVSGNVFSELIVKNKKKLTNIIYPRCYRVNLLQNTSLGFFVNPAGAAC